MQKGRKHQLQFRDRQMLNALEREAGEGVYGEGEEDELDEDSNCVDVGEVNK